MSDAPVPEHFSEWNEQMVARYDPDVFHHHPLSIVRWVENGRVRAVIRLLGAQPEHRVLDVGCGAGNILGQLRARELHGLELSPFMLKRAQGRLGQRAKIVLGDAERMPYAPASFDRVVASSLLSHVLHPAKVISELKRVTKPGGRIVISISDEPQIEKGIRWMKALYLDRLFVGPQGDGQAAIYNVEYHLQRLSRPRLREVVGDQLAEVSMLGVPTVFFPVHWVAVYNRD